MENRGIRILVIDDEIGVIDIIKSFLGDKYIVEGCTKSLDGIKMIKQEMFDLLVLDYYIDEMNGEDVVSRIREFDNDIYIILLTGRTNSVDGLQSLEKIDIQNYCEKSQDFKHIFIAIESGVKSIEFLKNKKPTFSTRLKKLRKKHKMSQDDVAKYLGVKRAAVTSYEMGDNKPPVESIVKLAELFEVTTDYLLCYELKIIDE
jgi:DNA-binding NtrC family response regulator